MKNFTCKRCKKVIDGPVKINTYLKRLGHKMIEVVDPYCRACFEKLNREQSWNEHRKEKKTNKRKN